MGHLPLAFSVHNFIKSVGSDAGFASIIGLALLVLLYFAHARETSVLRNHAEEAAQRIQQLEAQVAQLGRQSVPAAVPATGVQPVMPARAPAPASATVAASAYPAGAGQTSAGQTAVAAVHAPGAVGAPAGVGAPALTSATRLIPAGAVNAPAPAGGPPPSTPAANVVQAPPPPPAPAGTNGTGEHVLAPQSAAGARAAGVTRSVPRPVAARPAAPARPPVQIRPGASAARAGSIPPRGGSSLSGSPGFARRALPALIAVVALGAVVALLLILTSGNGGTMAASTSTPASNAPTAHRHRTARPKAAFNPANVTVTVLNGTATSGLAHRISVKLTSAGYKQGTVASASDATRTATVVSYLPGHGPDALQVAKALKLGSASVQRIDPSTQAIACPPPSQCAASVVVTVGADLSNQ